MLSPFILVLLATASGGSGTRGPAPAIADGVPWQVEIYSNFSDFTPEERKRPMWELTYRCGGIFVAPKWVLTAAHCIQQKNVNNWRVRLGTLDLGSGDGVTYLVDRVVTHPGYKDPNPGIDPPLNDLAMIHFTADTQTDERKPAAMSTIRLNGTKPSDSAVPVGEQVTVTGWGKAGNHRAVRYLRQGAMKTLDCKALPAWSDRHFTDSMICAGAPHVDSCNGDSGGPLVRTYGEAVVVGVVSWGSDVCAQEGTAGVYTRIDSRHYLDWIKRTIAPAKLGGGD